ncbi:hypothetical protein GW17_00005598 [Ensete ventricosum]|nr:hypothetical protein GW17_00005598 [Ensete ventricosum]
MSFSSFLFSVSAFFYQSIGAVNTIVKRPTDGKLIGYNTDYVGAISAIEDAIRGITFSGNSISSSHVCYLAGSKGVENDAETVSPLAGKVFVVIGAGGAGKALAYGAKEKGAKVVIANRTYGNFFLKYN